MAELNTSGPKKKDAGGKKTRKQPQDAHVDLTAMVDLAFLLITFFMLTTSLSKPQSMNLALPDKSQEAKPSLVAETRTVTLLLGTNNQLVWYLGQLDAPLREPEVINYGRDGLRSVLLEMQQYVRQIAHTEERSLIVIIKPSDRSTYRNLIDALDEMVITGVGQYAIVEISPEELDLLTQKGLN